MSYSEEMFLDEAPLPWEMSPQAATYALTDWRGVVTPALAAQVASVFVLAAVVIAGGVGWWVINKIRPW